MDLKDKLLGEQRQTQASLERLKALIRLIQRDQVIQVTMTATTTTTAAASLLSLPWIKPTSSSGGANSPSAATAPPMGPGALLQKSLPQPQGNNWPHCRSPEITCYKNNTQTERRAKKCFFLKVTYTHQYLHMHTHDWQPCSQREVLKKHMETRSQEGHKRYLPCVDFFLKELLCLMIIDLKLTKKNKYILHSIHNKYFLNPTPTVLKRFFFYFLFFFNC